MCSTSASTINISPEGVTAGCAPIDGNPRVRGGIGGEQPGALVFARRTQPTLERQHQRVVHRVDGPEAQTLTPQHPDTLGVDLGAHVAHEGGLADPCLAGVHQDDA